MKDVIYKSLDFMGYPMYRVGNDGSVWSCYVHGPGSRTCGVWTKKKPTSDGSRCVVNLSDGKLKTYTVSRLVLFAFVGPCPEGMECCHNDGNHTNNQVDNLRWDTPKENQADRAKHGTSNQGVRNRSAKLNEEQVREIRRLYATGGFSLSMLARKYQVTVPTIHPIVQRRTWKHVK
jgi:hypothetical protein